MTDPLRKPVSGDEFQPSARQTGIFIDAALATRQLSRESKQLIGELDAGIVLVRNDTGSDLISDKPIICLGDPLITPLDRENVVYDRPVFFGKNLVGDKWGILSGPLKAGSIGEAVVSGVAWARIEVFDESHTHATTSGSTSALTSSETGSGFILWREGGSGEQWALIRISNPTGTSEEESGSSGSGSGSGDGSPSGDGDGGESGSGGSSGSGDGSPSGDGDGDGDGDGSPSGDGDGSGSGDSGSGSGSGDSGNGSGSRDGSPSGDGDGSGSGDLPSGGCQEITFVSDVQCLGGEIVVTKKTMCVYVCDSCGSGNDL